MTNHKIFSNNRVKVIKIGKDISWSDNLKKGLNKLNYEYVLLLIDDLIISKKISNNFFCKISKWIDINEPDYLRLINSFKPLKFDELVGKIPIKSAYKTSTMPAIWKKSVLLELLKNGESAWDFEIFGSKRAFSYKNFYSTNKNFIDYYNSIIKGKWQQFAALKFNINKGSRPIMNNLEQSIYSIKVVRSKIFNSLSASIRNILKGY